MRNFSVRSVAEIVKLFIKDRKSICRIYNLDSIMLSSYGQNYVFDYWMKIHYKGLWMAQN